MSPVRIPCALTWRWADAATAGLLGGRKVDVEEDDELVEGAGRVGWYLEGRAVEGALLPVAGGLPAMRNLPMAEVSEEVEFAVVVDALEGRRLLPPAVANLSEGGAMFDEAPAVGALAVEERMGMYCNAGQRE